jgi:hypothetical protein
MHETLSTLKSFISWDIKPCSSLKLSRRFGGTCRLHLQGRRISQARNQHKAGGFLLVYSSTLKRKATCSSETSVDFQRTTQHYIPEDINFHNYRCENLKSYIVHIILKDHDNFPLCFNLSYHSLILNM